MAREVRRNFYGRSGGASAKTVIVEQRANFASVAT